MSWTPGYQIPTPNEGDGDAPGGGAVDSVDGRTGVVTLDDLYDAAGSAAAVGSDLADLEADLPGTYMQIFGVAGYGATGDGSTDDTTAIQAAMDAAAANGGIVSFPPGTFLTETLIIDTGVVLQGVGPDSTTLKLKAGTDAAVVQTADWVALSAGNTQGGPHSWGIRDLTIDANKAENTTAGFCLRAYGYGYTLTNVVLRNAKTTNLVSQWSDAAGEVAPDGCEARITNAKIHNSDGSGVEWDGPHDSQWSNLVIYLNATHGFHAKAKGTANQMSNVHSWGLGQDWAFYLESTGNTLTGCDGEGATNGQVFVGANDNSIDGGHYFGAGVVGSYGVQIGDGSAISGTVVNTKITSCTAGALNFGNDGGSRVTAHVFQTAGAAVAGTPSTDSQLDLTVLGGATGAQRQVQGDLVMRQTAPARMGQATLVSGKAQIFTASITALSYVFVTRITPAGTLGHLVVENVGGTDRAAGAWFFVSSVDSTGAVETADTSTINWMLIEPI